MAKATRFASLSETDLVKLSESKDSKNTKAATKHSVKLFRTYLAEKGHDSSFETYTNGVLNSRLRLFYAEVRNASGERYKRTSLIAIRSGICRYLCQSNNIDITRDVDFKEANDMFVCMCKDTCKTGKGTVDHKVSIEKADLERLYSSRMLDTTTPYGLLNKVWFELCLYFCRRGRENQRELKPSMFNIRTDALGKRYVCQVDSEVSKNHQGIKHSEIQDKNVRMYETGGRMCPVKSFEKYLSKLNP
ncbi:zinc finger MYM-type protein 2-like [Ruditapes philippinarum]|uniref:zinc finger MYM-type protein 2-like n=1 Tax=Ruditapes philippinarum TaxID=129788 RepID=UPI00295AB816|nr:zinc finger MYM-type protein 2-like [Ruditapes philippinarum]